ncbi:hypothetical protein CAPN008_01410 [Capnocytophaga canis]|uniref:hypothetical protein n=1 Tax=Capnocytophaga canis TaxID=1848903 RepID=UPI001AC777BB|nr:hypothetical protein [Capnocytophaga canis]GIM60091.1 hypothetical protein CAPN008_01410 [Capnocytophaga canis]
MSKPLKWGKPKIEFLKNQDGGIPDSPSWQLMPTPVENTTKISTEKGDKKEAKIEGGEVIAVRVGKSKYTLEFELYDHKGFTPPIPEDDGLVEGNYAFRITYEDDSIEGIQIDNAAVSAERTWDSENGAKIKYICEVLKPKTGKTIKPYSG